MVNWILVELENDNYWSLVFGFLGFLKKMLVFFPNEN